MAKILIAILILAFSAVPTYAKTCSQEGYGLGACLGHYEYFKVSSFNQKTKKVCFMQGPPFFVDDPTTWYGGTDFIAPGCNEMNWKPIRRGYADRTDWAPDSVLMHIYPANEGWQESLNENFGRFPHTQEFYIGSTFGENQGSMVTRLTLGSSVEQNLQNDKFPVYFLNGAASREHIGARTTWRFSETNLRNHGRNYSDSLASDRVRFQVASHCNAYHYKEKKCLDIAKTGREAFVLKSFLFSLRHAYNAAGHSTYEVAYLPEPKGTERVNREFLFRLSGSLQRVDATTSPWNFFMYNSAGVLLQIDVGSDWGTYVAGSNGPGGSQEVAFTVNYGGNYGPLALTVQGAETQPRDQPSANALGLAINDSSQFQRFHLREAKSGQTGLTKSRMFSSGVDAVLVPSFPKARSRLEQASAKFTEEPFMGVKFSTNGRYGTAALMSLYRIKVVDNLFIGYEPMCIVGYELVKCEKGLSATKFYVRFARAKSGYSAIPWQEAERHSKNKKK